ncbi:hypothetical protein ACPCUV_26675 [Streptomyces platensis]|uniref:hypothetical protein n=1 Tax=Streptomyces platensis TaxID=58346 RepID=UPI003C2CF35A
MEDGGCRDFAAASASSGGASKNTCRVRYITSDIDRLAGIATGAYARIGTFRSQEA